MLKDLVIRPFAATDLEELTEVWHDVNRSAYPYVAAHQRYTLDEARAFFRSNVLPFNRLWVASLGTSIVGFIAVDAAHINQLAIAVSYQHRGIGSALLRYLLETTEGSWRLFTFQRNESARRFYEKHGFRAVGFGVSPPPENEPDVEYLLERSFCGPDRADFATISMPVNPLPRDYSREPTILDPQTVHAFVRELLDHANANRTWGVEVAEALVDLIATRLSDTYSSLDPALAREVLSGIQANWSPEPLAYVDALCTVLANLGDTRPFLREKMATEQSPEVRALLAEILAELDRSFADERSRG